MDIQVEISCGSLKGVHRAGVFQFCSVPYAEDPIGSLRFSPPQPKAPWAGVLDATQPAKVAPQTTSRLATVMGDFAGTQDEACLTLSINTPGLDKKKRPVIVWLHGGGFSSGGGALDWYDGRQLAELGDVVVVGVNYRLGALGFLVAQGVSEGNLGLQDQALALSYVRDNIASFGGDPDNITLMGQSAGGNSIAALFASRYDTTGVRRIILQSPALGMPPQTLEQAQSSGHAFLKALGLDPQARNLRSKLEALPTTQILQAQAEVARSKAQYGDTTPPFQLYEGHEAGLHDDFPRIAASALKDIDVLIGITDDEAHAFLMQSPQTQIISAKEVSQCVRNVYGDEALERFRQIQEQYPDEYAGSHFSRLISNEVFSRPAQEFAHWAQQGGNHTYFYVFDWQPKGSPFKSCHCLELPFVFGISEAWAHAPMLGATSHELLACVTDVIQASWLAFARSGAPNTQATHQWNRFTDHEPCIMRLSDTPQAQAKPLCVS